MAQQSGRLSDVQVRSFIRRASELFKRSGYVAAHPPDLSEDFRKLELLTCDEQESAIENILQEISPKWYKGPHPPNHIAHEPKCRGARMLQFVWFCSYLNREICFKFAVHGRPSKERLFVIGIHDDYDPTGFEKLEQKNKKKWPNN